VLAVPRGEFARSGHSNHRRWQNPFCQPEREDRIGYTPEELFHANVFERVHADDLPHVQEQFALAECSPSFRYRHSDGSWRWLQATAREFLPPDGQKRGC
jgi:PAS domain S-box-containing protein